MITLEFIHRVGGTLTDVTSVVLRNPDASFGVRRNDTNAIIVAAGTAMTRQSLGRYTYELTEPAAGLTYTWWAERVYGGLTYWAEFTATGATPATSAYLTRAAADALAANMLLVETYTSATDAKRSAALEMASDRIDRAMRYQGRRYLATQPREFPRIPYATGAEPLATGQASSVWDWDSETNTAVVPASVLKAVVYEAAALLSPGREKRLQAMQDGLASQSTGGLAESYRPTSAGVITLSLQAEQLLSVYRLRSGGMR